MFGNPNTTAADDVLAANVLPPGIPDTERERTDEERCADPAFIPACVPAGGGCAAGTGFFDDEYNPEGQYDVFTFCDGGELPTEGRSR